MKTNETSLLSQAKLQPWAEAIPPSQTGVLVCSVLPRQAGRLQRELNPCLSHPLTCKFFTKSYKLYFLSYCFEKKGGGRRGKHLHLLQENAF